MFRGPIANGAFFPFTDKLDNILMELILDIITISYKIIRLENASFFYGIDIALTFGLQ
jgi:hypothetical protein